MNQADQMLQLQQLYGGVTPGTPQLQANMMQPGGGMGQPLQGAAQTPAGMAGQVQALGGAQPPQQMMQQPSVGQQYQQFMANGGLAYQPTLSKPTTDDEWAQKVYMDHKYQVARGQEMSQFLQEREQRSNSG